MNSGFLGIDTSNYTTSCAICRAGEMVGVKRLLPVPKGQLGLRQSDAVFSHVKALGELMVQLREKDSGIISAVGVSIRPRDVEGSYMPCFLSGVMVAQSVSAVLNIPLYTFSHQAGHIAAALFGAKRLDLFDKSFVAFHVSGGTTECLHVKSLPNADIELLFAANDLNAGQVVDRVGGMLSLPFPAGPALDDLAQKSSRRYKTRPAFNKENPCLSGIENQCGDMLKRGESSENVARFCIDSILNILVIMAQNAKDKTGCKNLLFAGGVMSNTIIKAELQERFDGIFAPKEFSCDNAAGIALLAARADEKAVEEKGAVK